MKFLLVIISVFFACQQVSGQKAMADSIKNSHEAQLVFFNKEFEGLTSKEPLKKIEERLKIETNSLNGCLIVLQFGKDKYVGLDSLEKKAIIERIEEIADQFLEEGSPILIFGTGLNSVEKTMSLNSEPNKHNLIYITQGNSCLGDDSMEGEGISAFNQRTLKRLGLEAFPIQEMKGSTIKKRKRKTRPNTSYLGLNGTLQSTNRKRKGIIMLDGL